MLEIHQNPAGFFEVRAGEQVRYTCLREEDAVDFKNRHANDPPENSRASKNIEEMSCYVTEPHRHHRVRSLTITHQLIEVFSDLTPHTSEYWRFNAEKSRWYFLEKKAR